MKNQKKIFIMDDHEIFLNGLKLAIQSNGIAEHVETFINEEVFYTRAIIEKPHLIIVDHILEKCTGIEIISKIKTLHNSVKSVLISSIKDVHIKYFCINNGIDGYLHKSEPENVIVFALKQIINCGTYYSSIQNPTLEKEISDKKNPFFQLTNRELEIVRCLVRGMQHQEIGEEIGITTKTVQNHCFRISEKLGKLSTVKLARIAYLWGIVKEEDLGKLLNDSL